MLLRFSTVLHWFDSRLIYRSFSKSAKNAYFWSQNLIPIFQGSFPLFATLPPFRNTFSESLGVAKRGTTGVLVITVEIQAYTCYRVDSLSKMLPSSYGWGVLFFLTFKGSTTRGPRAFQTDWSALAHVWRFPCIPVFRIAAIKPATIAEIISAPTNIKNWIRTSSIFQVQNLNSLLTYLKHPFKWPIRLVQIQCTTTKINFSKPSQHRKL